jgi:hypothetical protein
MIGDTTSEEKVEEVCKASSRLDEDDEEKLRGPR